MKENTESLKIKLFKSIENYFKNIIQKDLHTYEKGKVLQVTSHQKS